jgi:sugar lactone lactonase YvrE
VRRTISNPYAAVSQRNRTLVADAGANTIVSVDRKGEVSLFALLPDPPTGEITDPETGETFDTDAVPTSIAEDRHGNIYVGTLASELPGEASVFVYGPRGGDPIKVIEGFTTVTGVAVGRDGSIYVSELFGGDPTAIPPGQLTKIARDGTRTTIPVPLPAGIAVDRWNNVYVAAWSISPADGLVPPDAPPGTPVIPDSDGQVWRLRF